MDPLKCEQAYPECEKLAEVAPRSGEISQFIEWAQEQGIVLARYNDHYHSGERLLRVNDPIEQLLARYFEIDLNAVERERAEILASISQ